MNGADFLQLAQRLRNHAYTRLIRGSFASFGRGSVIVAPVRLVAAERIHIGSNSYIGSGSWIQGEVTGHSTTNSGTLRLGNRVSITGSVVISAASSVTIGDDVLVGKGAHISDHTHATNGSQSIRDQGITEPRRVVIEKGAWLGQNVVVMPGVSIGEGAVIGANSIVSKDVPAHTLAVGAPLRLIRDVRETPPAPQDEAN